MSEEQKDVNAKTEVPIETLDELINYLTDKYYELTSGDVPDDNGICFKLAKYLSYLKQLKKIVYLKCAQCGRTIAPDEEYIISDENLYCIGCMGED